MKTHTAFISLALVIASIGQAQPLADQWPTYNGDFSGRRYSSLHLINDGNIQNLSLRWTVRIADAGPGAPITSGPGGAPIVGGSIGSAVRVAGTPLMVNGMLYFTANDNAWAVDARNGREIWHWYRTSVGNGGLGTNNKGMGMYGNWLYFLTRDDFLVSLDATTGKQRWIKPVADPKQFYFSSVPPVVIGNHVLIGTGGDNLDIPGFLQARDPETGDEQWTRYTTPKAGEPGIETWPDAYASTHGGGGPWIPGTYDPELNLYYFGTGNPNPVYAPQSRQGSDLYTCTILAINPDTGKIAWYFQSSPHDTHDWDAVQTPVLFDVLVNGQKRKLLAQASRNGYFFVLDRQTGKNILTAPMIESLNWSSGVSSTGQPIPNPAKEPSVGGTLVAPSSGGVTGWQPPAFNPDTGLFYVNTSQSYSIFYLSDTDDHPEGYGGIESGGGTIGPGALQAIDYRTGKAAWRHEWMSGSGGGGILTTAGNLVFTPSGNKLIAFNATNGNILWGTSLLAGPSAPITYMLDGKQCVTVIAADVIYSFVMNSPAK